MSELFPTYDGPLPYITAAQMREVDRAMIEDYRIGLIQMMENAGRNLAHLARSRFLDGDPVGKAVVVMAGTGGNGGGALVAARRLANYGAAVTVYTTRTDDIYTGVPDQQLSILRRMGVTVEVGAPDSFPAVDLIIDGLIGYSLRGAPGGHAGNLIRVANRSTAPVLALDMPSGLDTATGITQDPTIQATATMTLALPKVGLQGAFVVGELYLADISVPPGLYAGDPLNLDVGPIFSGSDVVRIG
jgi:NAD(P)H-hydrate epimerase